MKDYSTEIGKKYGELTVKQIVREYDKNNNSRLFAICDCSCGTKNERRYFQSLNLKSICFVHKFNQIQKEECGKTYGHLTIRKIVHKSENGHNINYAICDCDCGITGEEYYLYNIKKGATTACKNHFLNELKKTEIGKQYGYLTIKDFKYGLYKNVNQVMAICDCACGKKDFEIAYSLLKHGVKSCGCFFISNAKNEIGKKYGKLTVKGLLPSENRNGIKAVCDCDCGSKDVKRYLNDLHYKVRVSCGCTRDFQSLREPDIGKKFGKLVVKQFVIEDKVTYAICDCDCGKKNIKINYGHIKNNKVKSCGCLTVSWWREESFENENLVGKQFGNWTIISKTTKVKNKNAVWLCQCSCKKKTLKELSTFELTHEIYKSCGCDYLFQETRLCMLKTRIEGKINTNNTSGINGVYYRPDTKKYSARITLQKHTIYLGCFNTIGEAYLARKKAEEKYYLPLLEKRFTIEQIKQMIKEEHKKEFVPKKVAYSDSHGINTMDIEIAKDLNSIKKEYTK